MGETERETDKGSSLERALDLLPASLTEHSLSAVHHERIRTIVGPYPFFTYPANSKAYPDNFENYGEESIRAGIDFEFQTEQPAPGTPNRMRQNRILDANSEPLLLRDYHDRLFRVTSVIFNSTRAGYSPDFWSKFVAELPPQTQEEANNMHEREPAERPTWQQVAAAFCRELYAEMDREGGGNKNFLPDLLALIQIDNQSNRVSCNFVSGSAARYCDADFTSTELCTGISKEIRALGLQPLNTEVLFAGIPESRPYGRFG